jgi:hypothetical protein
MLLYFPVRRSASEENPYEQKDNNRKAGRSLPKQARILQPAEAHADGSL